MTVKLRHMLALEYLETHANRARQDDVGRDAISDAERQKSRHLIVGELKDINDQPNAEYAKAQHGHSLKKSCDGSHRLISRLRFWSGALTAVFARYSTYSGQSIMLCSPT